MGMRVASKLMFIINYIKTLYDNGVDILQEGVVSRNHRKFREVDLRAISD